jgi:dTMP kinase
MTSEAELLLIFAARAQHIQQIIRPALAAGHWVLCDRFTDASYAYQGCGRGVDKQRIALLANWVQQDLTPDLTLLLDIPVEQGLQRAKQRSAPDRFEAETSDFFTQVRAEYLRLAACDPNRVTRVDATRSLSQVQQHIQQAIQRLLPYGH